MKILTIFGTRPEFIRLSVLIKKLDASCEHILVHTGQNYDKNLNDIFLNELGIRKADYYLNAHGTFAQTIATIYVQIEEICKKEKPDIFLVLGDTNSSMAAYIAKRLGIKVYHMEAGNRCYDEKVPEEVNRRVIDHSSDILLPYTNNSKNNLLKEGIAADKIIVTGNPIYEVIATYNDLIRASTIKEVFGIVEKKYVLATLHREENVDVKGRLATFIRSFEEVVATYDMPLIWSVHPRTKKRLTEWNLFPSDKRIIISEPLGFSDFVHLERNAFLVMSDSGTVQEECCIFGVPTVTLRDTTERPETVDVGSNIITGCDTENILNAVKSMISAKTWIPPEEYMRSNVSDIVHDILLGKIL